MDDDETSALAVPHARPWGTRAWLTTAAILAVVLLAVLPGSADAATGPHIVRADGDCLRMRSVPSLSGVMLACLAEGSQVFALGETADADGLRWERISAGGQTGWAAAIYLVPGTAATPAPTPVVSVPTAVPTATPVPATGTINGAVSTGGGFSLVLWTGGRIEALLSVAEGRGCGVKSVWVSRSGTLIAYIAGAPSFVNEQWNSQVGAGVLGEMPVILVCTAGGTSAPTPAPTPPGPVAPVATPTPAPPTGTSPGSNFPRDTPPGPAGNE